MAIPVTVTVDDALKSKLTEYLDHLEAGIKQGGDFVATQAPDVVNQMVAYNLASTIVMLVVFGAVIVAIAVSVRRSLAYKVQFDDSVIDCYHFVIRIVGPIAVVFLLPFCVAQIDTILKCWLAPKYFILEQIISLVK